METQEILRKYDQLVALNLRYMPRALRDQFKAYCARRGYSMHRAVTALMKKAIREDLRLVEARRGGQT